MVSGDGSGDPPSDIVSGLGPVSGQQAPVITDNAIDVEIVAVAGAAKMLRQHAPCCVYCIARAATDALALFVGKFNVPTARPDSRHARE